MTDSFQTDVGLVSAVGDVSTSPLPPIQPREIREGEPSPYLTPRRLLLSGRRKPAPSPPPPLLEVGDGLVKVTPACSSRPPSCHRSSHLPIVFCQLARCRSPRRRASGPPSAASCLRLPTMFPLQRAAVWPGVS